MDPKLANPLHVVLVAPEIAANAGAIGRTCVAVGATLWLVRPLGFRLDDRHRRRAGLDYWDHLDHRVVDGPEEFLAARPAGNLWSFSTKAKRLYTQADFHPGDALVFGSESRGLPETWRRSQPVDHLLRIPMRPQARSLNLANAVAIAVYEALRQIGSPDLWPPGEPTSNALTPGSRRVVAHGPNDSM